MICIKTIDLEKLPSWILSYKDLETILFNRPDANRNLVAHVLQIQKFIQA